MGRGGRSPTDQVAVVFHQLLMIILIVQDLHAGPLCSTGRSWRWPAWPITRSNELGKLEALQPIKSQPTQGGTGAGTPPLCRHEQHCQASRYSTADLMQPADKCAHISNIAHVWCTLECDGLSSLNFGLRSVNNYFRPAALQARLPRMFHG